MKDLIKRYWDLFGGAFATYLLSLSVKFKLDGIQLISAEIILFLVCIGLFSTIKIRMDKKLSRKKMVLDKMVANQKHMKAIGIAHEPTKQGEELAIVLIDTMKGGKKLMQKIKNMFVWIGKYWQQLVGIATVIGEYAIYVYALVCDKLEFALQHLPQENAWQIGGKVAIGVIVTLIVALQIRNMCKWVGVGTIEQATEYIEAHKEEVKSKLSSSAKESIKEALKTYKSNLKSVVKSISSIKSKIEETEKEIASVKELLQLGLGDQQKYNELMSAREQLKNELATNEQKEQYLTNEIQKYKQVL